MLPAGWLGAMVFVLALVLVAWAIATNSERFRSVPRTCRPFRRQADYAIDRPDANSGRKPDVRHEAARVYRAHRQHCGSMAARGARAAGRADAAHRRVNGACRKRSGLAKKFYRIYCRTAGSGLDRMFRFPLL